MKKAVYFFTLIALSLFTTLSAQDVIQLKTGEIISAKVLAIGDQISYKKPSNPDGPLYLLNRYEVDYITYPNGEIDYFGNDGNIAYEREHAPQDDLYDHYLSSNYREYFEGYRLISKDEFLAKLQTNPLAYDYYQKGKKMTLTGGILSGLGIVVIAVSSSPRQTQSNNNFGLNRPPSSIETGPSPGVWLGAGVMVGGIATMGLGSTYCRNALNTYNIEQGQKLGVVPVINADGLGLALRF